MASVSDFTTEKKLIRDGESNFQARNRMYISAFPEEDYTGTAEQNIKLLNLLMGKFDSLVLAIPENGFTLPSAESSNPSGFSMELESAGFQMRLCAEGEAKLFLGIKAEACFIQSSKTELTFNMTVCGTAGIKTPDLGIGVDVGFTAMACYDSSWKITPQSTEISVQDFLRVLTGPGSDGKSARSKLLNKAKNSLLSASPEELEKIGLSPASVNQSLSHNHPHAASR
jgi:hypothetical protein